MVFIFMNENKKKQEKKRTIWVRDIFKERNQKRNIQQLYARNAIEN